MTGYPRLLIAKDVGERNSVLRGERTEYPCLVDLPDPKTRELRQYLVTASSIQECNAIQRRWSSWLTGNSIISDGNLYAWTPVNIVFLLLQALENVRQQENFCSIDHIVESVGSGNGTFAILRIIEAEKGTLKDICDWKENEGACFFKLNNHKLFSWLQSRVNSVARYLAGRHPSFAAMPKTSLESYSIGIISEYLPAPFSSELYRIFGIEKPLEKCVSHMDHSLLEEPRKARFDKKRMQEMRSISAREEEKEKRRKKETAGMQKLTSFFSRR